MASKKLERQLAMDALAGKRPGAELLTNGLRVFADVRVRVGPMARDAGYLTDKHRTRIRLPYGASLDLFHNPGPGNGSMAIVGSLNLRTGKSIQSQLPSVLAGWIVDRAKGDAEVLAKACAGIERARRALFEAAEQSTRWL